MLILTRNIDQAIVIGGDIVMRLIRKMDFFATFTITAPAGTVIDFIAQDGAEPRTIFCKPITVTLLRGDWPVRVIRPDGNTCDIRCFERGHLWRNQVRMGFTAPRTLSVHRDEIAQRISDTGPRSPLAAVLTAGLLSVLLSGCATGNELHGAWLLTVGRAGPCRVVEHRSSTDQLNTRTVWRGEGCNRQADDTLQPTATATPSMAVSHDR